MKKSALIFLITVFVCVLTVMTASADFKDDFTDTDHAANGWRERLLFGMPGTEYLFPEEGKNRYEWQPEPGGGYEIDLDAGERRAF